MFRLAEDGLPHELRYPYLKASVEMIFDFFSSNLAFRLPWQAINWAVWTKLVYLTTQRSFLLRFCQSNCSEIATNASFHFSHEKSMTTLNCHSNQSSATIEIKQKVFLFPPACKVKWKGNCQQTIQTTSMSFHRHQIPNGKGTQTIKTA